MHEFIATNIKQAAFIYYLSVKYNYYNAIAAADAMRAILL